MPTASPDGRRVVRDVPYAAADGTPTPNRSLDLHLPAADRRSDGEPDGGPPSAGRPVLVYVHGGGWRVGDRTRVGQKADFFTGRGWLFVSVGYRLGAAGADNADARDVAAALDWVARHVGEYGGDPHRVALVGHSAGAHLAVLAAVDPAVRTADPPPRALVSLDTAALDVPRMMRLAGPRGARLYRSKFGTDPDGWPAASPYHRLGADGGGAPRNPGGPAAPPTLLVVADGNRAKLDQARRFAAKLETRDVGAELLEAPGKDHTSLNRDLGTPGDAVTARLIDFLDARTAPRPPAP